MANKYSTTWLIWALFKLICAVHAASIAHLKACRPIGKINTNNVSTYDCIYDKRTTIEDYLAKRKQFIDSEIEHGFGCDIQLNENEQHANTIIMAAKEAEYANGIFAPDTFHPSRHIFQTFATIKQSKLFQTIQKMPKGGVLHAHGSALCSADYIVSLTYWPHLWQFSLPNGTDIRMFLFSLTQPNTTVRGDSQHVWRRVNEVRHEIGTSKFDKYIRTLFTLYDENVRNPTIQFNDINAVWEKFLELFSIVKKLLTYQPIWKAYYKQALKEMYDDGVQYLEVRSALPLVSIAVHGISGKILIYSSIFSIICLLDVTFDSYLFSCMT